MSVQSVRQQPAQFNLCRMNDVLNLTTNQVFADELLDCLYDVDDMAGHLISFRKYLEVCKLHSTAVAVSQTSSTAQFNLCKMNTVINVTMNQTFAECIYAFLEEFDGLEPYLHSFRAQLRDHIKMIPPKKSQMAK